MPDPFHEYAVPAILGIMLVGLLWLSSGDHDHFV